MVLTLYRPLSQRCRFYGRLQNGVNLWVIARCRSENHFTKIVPYGIFPRTARGLGLQSVTLAMRQGGEKYNYVLSTRCEIEHGPNYNRLDLTSHDSVSQENRGKVEENILLQFLLVFRLSFYFIHFYWKKGFLLSLY